MRVERVIGKRDARRIRLPSGLRCVDFSSNSYLGLHETLTARAVRKFLRESRLTSAGSSRMVSGTHPSHRRLESSLARFLGTEEAAVFGSGFLCCAGVIEAVTGSRDMILFDERIHASLRTGISLSTATSIPYRHADAADLETKLRTEKPAGRCVIVTDGLFSMDGDFAPLDKITKLANRHSALLIVDDAHGIGAVGRSGRGTFEKFGLRPGRSHILIGTLSKTFASFGGFVAAAGPVVRYIKSRSKEFIYTTAAPPFQIAVAEIALDVVRSKHGKRLREKLNQNMRRLSDHLGRPIESPIVRVPVSGGPVAVLRAARKLWKAGCFAIGMRYPTVPRGQEMIRISLSAAHTRWDIAKLVDALKRI